MGEFRHESEINHRTTRDCAVQESAHAKSNGLQRHRSWLAPRQLQMPVANKPSIEYRDGPRRNHRFRVSRAKWMKQIEFR